MATKSALDVPAIIIAVRGDKKMGNKVRLLMCVGRIAKA